MGIIFYIIRRWEGDGSGNVAQVVGLRAGGAPEVGQALEVGLRGWGQRCGSGGVTPETDSGGGAQRMGFWGWGFDAQTKNLSLFGLYLNNLFLNYFF